MCGSNAFSDINKWECTLHIPEGTTARYAAAYQWRDFFFVNEDATGINGTRIGNKAEERSRYNAKGQQINGEHRGINIIRMSDGTTKKVYVR